MANYEFIKITSFDLGHSNTYLHEPASLCFGAEKHNVTENHCQ